MSLLNEGMPTAEDLRQSILSFIETAVAKNGGSTKARKPGHRLPFHWPPHPVSYSYHVLASDWTSQAEFTTHGEKFVVEVARTPYGVFGRSPALWHEARGETLEQMLQNLKESAEPLFRRQFAISECLGMSARYQGTVHDLPPADIVKLLYCRDRDVANDAMIQIETMASSHIFGPALVEILRDNRHPDRRGAQWCVLDLFEDLPSVCCTPEEQDQAIEAMKGLLWDAEDDYARTVYKAGVVLGGHLPNEQGGKILLDCLAAPSKIGRRSAIHGLFHTVEWFPEMKEDVVSALRVQSEKDPDTILRAFAAGMAEDIEERNFDHVAEPVFPDEV